MHVIAKFCLSWIFQRLGHAKMPLYPCAWVKMATSECHVTEDFLGGRATGTLKCQGTYYKRDTLHCINIRINSENRFQVLFYLEAFSKHFIPWKKF